MNMASGVPEIMEHKTQRMLCQRQSVILRETHCATSVCDKPVLQMHGRRVQCFFGATGNHEDHERVKPTPNCLARAGVFMKTKDYQASQLPGSRPLTSMTAAFTMSVPMFCLGMAAACTVACLQLPCRALPTQHCFGRCECGSFSVDRADKNWRRVLARHEELHSLHWSHRDALRAQAEEGATWRCKLCGGQFDALRRAVHHSCQSSERSLSRKRQLLRRRPVRPNRIRRSRPQATLMPPAWHRHRPGPIVTYLDDQLFCFNCPAGVGAAWGTVVGLSFLCLFSSLRGLPAPSACDAGCTALFTVHFLVVFVVL